MARIDALMDEAGTPEQLEETLMARLRRGEELHGFGHRLYPSGDPRALLLTKLLQAYATDTEGAQFAIKGLELGQKLLKRSPEISYVMVCMQRALQLPKEAPLVFFAVGRTVGWIAHSIEHVTQCSTKRSMVPSDDWNAVTWKSCTATAIAFSSAARWMTTTWSCAAAPIASPRTNGRTALIDWKWCPSNEVEHRSPV